MKNHEIRKYPDGSSYAVIDAGNKITSTVFKVNSYEGLWHLLQYCEAMYHMGARGLNITIPNLIDAQADRRFEENQSFGLKLVCNFLNDIVNKYEVNFTIFHPHNQEVLLNSIDNVKILPNTQFITEVLSDIFDKSDWETAEEMTENLILMSSDAGGFKPLMSLCNNIGWRGETFSASKARSWDEEEGTKFVQQVDRQDFGGKDILIIDDLSIGGGTFKGLSKLLKGKNVGRIMLATSHFTVQDLGSNPVTNFFDYCFTTNSKFDNYGVKGYKDHTVDSEFTDIEETFEQPDNLIVKNLF